MEGGIGCFLREREREKSNSHEMFELGKAPLTAKATRDWPVRLFFLVGLLFAKWGYARNIYQGE